jgi:hypothetical protein
MQPRGNNSAAIRLIVCDKRSHQIFVGLLPQEQTTGFPFLDLRTRLQSTQHLHSCGQDRKKSSSKASRIFRRFRAHGLIAKIPRTRRWRVTRYGRRVMGTVLYLRETDVARAYAKLAA